METSNKLQEAVCFICGSLQCSKDNHFGSTSFRMLMRYLDIDVVNLSTNLPWFSLVDMEAPVVNLCEGCGSKVNVFWQFFRELEVVRLSLDNCIQSLYDLMKTGRGYGGMTQMLWKETRKKCSIQVASLPRVKLASVGKDNIKCHRKIIPALSKIIQLDIPASETNPPVNFKISPTLDSTTTRQGRWSTRHHEAFCCQTCPQRFRSEATLKVHIFNNHFGQVVKVRKSSAVKKSEQNDSSTSPTKSEVETTEAPISSVKTSPPINAPLTKANNQSEKKTKLSSSSPEVQKGIKSSPKTPPKKSATRRPLPKLLPLKLVKTSGPGKSFRFKVLHTKRTTGAVKNPRKTYPPSRKMFSFRPQKMSQLKIIKTVSLAPPIPLQDPLALTPADFTSSKTALTLSSMGKVYTCSICRKLCYTYGSLMHHKKSHIKQPHEPVSSIWSTQRNKVICEFCQKSSWSSKDNWSHLLSVHIMELYATTIPPGTTELELKSASVGIVSKHKKYPHKCFGCPYCTRMTRSSAMLRIHVLDKHFDKVLIALESPHDPSLEPLRLKHIPPVKHALRKRDIKCEHCPKKLDNRVEYKLHVKKEHFELRPFHCLYCDNCYKTNKLLRLHCVKYHATTYLKKDLPPGTTELELNAAVDGLIDEDEVQLPDGRSSCHICDKWFQWKGMLKTHYLATHLNVIVQRLRPEPEPKEELLYPCATFGKSCSSKLSLKRHQKVHEGKTYAYKCDHCSKSFRTDGDRKTHIKLYHPVHHFAYMLPPGTKEDEVEDALRIVVGMGTKHGKAKYGCPQCSKTFPNTSDLKRHIVRVHFSFVVENLIKNKVDI